MWQSGPAFWPVRAGPRPVSGQREMVCSSVEAASSIGRAMEMATMNYGEDYGLHGELQRSRKKEDIQEVVLLTLQTRMLAVVKEEAAINDNLARSATDGVEGDEDGPLDFRPPSSIPAVGT